MQDKIEAADDWPQADEATASRRYVLTGAAGLKRIPFILKHSLRA